MDQTVLTVTDCFCRCRRLVCLFFWGWSSGRPVCAAFFAAWPRRPLELSLSWILVLFGEKKSCRSANSSSSTHVAQPDSWLNLHSGHKVQIMFKARLSHMFIKSWCYRIFWLPKINLTPLNSPWLTRALFTQRLTVVSRLTWLYAVFIGCDINVKCRKLM